MKFIFALFCLSPLLAEQPITRLACGSCYKAHRDKGIFKTIAAEQAQLFLFMGDNIYGDSEDEEVMREKYRQLNAQPDYAAFKEQVPVLATWDDHDYGRNDAGRDFTFKESSARLFFEAFDFPQDHEARKSPGIYHSKILGPTGKRLQLIFLDTRSFRSPLIQVKKNRRKTYLPQKSPEATMLGKAQWAWLASELQKPADLRLIISSVQILATDHRFEKWANLPNERARFFKLLRDLNVGPTVLLSGDRHLGEVARLFHHQCGLPFDLYELTSSGMTHAGAPEDPWAGRIPNTYTKHINYGLIDITWTGKKPIVSLSLKSFKGEVQSSTIVDFHEQAQVK